MEQSIRDEQQSYRRLQEKNMQIMSWIDRQPILEKQKEESQAEEPGAAQNQGGNLEDFIDQIERLKEQHAHQ